MRNRSIVSALVLPATFPLLLACQDTRDSFDVLSPEPYAAQQDVQPDKWSCYDPNDPHCLPAPPDPNPSAPGVYLGNTEADCWAEFSNTNDSDGDLLDDMCEYQLAYNFRPLMRSATTDDTRGEAYWAVRPTASGRYQIFYALGYYWDFGADGHPLSPCVAATAHDVFLDVFGVDRTYYCDGHEGDSEFLVAEVSFDSASSHWLLEQMYRSAHYGTKADDSRWVPASSYKYPEHARWYPRIFVAINKHANYESVSRCESTAIGYFLGIIPVPYQRDNCSYAAYKEERVRVLESRNLGSRAHPAPDIPLGAHGNQYTCVSSQERFAGNGRYECFWLMGTQFHGWQEGNGATSYGDLLAARGF